MEKRTIYPRQTSVSPSAQVKVDNQNAIHWI